MLAPTSGTYRRAEGLLSETAAAAGQRTRRACPILPESDDLFRILLTILYPRPESALFTF